MSFIPKRLNRPHKRWRHAPHCQRRGTAVIETALLLPLLILLAFGSIELSNMVFMKQSLSIAAYEGARLVSKPGTTQAQAEKRIREVLTSRNVASYTVQFTTVGGVPIIVTTLTPRGTQLSVTVQSSNGGANYGPLQMFTGRSVQCQTTMVRQ